MDDGLERAREQRSAFERLGAMIPGFKGYLERELRREVDKLQRDWLAEQVDRARHELQGKIRGWSRRGNLANLDLASSIDKRLDRVANRIRHADYGFTGFFDAVKVYEPQLDRLYRFDLGLSEEVRDLADQIAALPETAAGPDLESLLDRTMQLDGTVDERATVFEDVTQSGG